MNNIRIRSILVVVLQLVGSACGLPGCSAPSMPPQGSAHVAAMLPYTPPPAPDGLITEHTYNGKHYMVCTASPKQYEIAVYNVAPDGSIHTFSSLYALKKERLVFAINGGIYQENLKALGLLVSAGKMQHRINTATGRGNFYMSPNGVFFIDSMQHAYVLTTQEYMKKNRSALFATQSGPMLVIDGAYNNNFTPGSKNLNIRNGVGVNDDGLVCLAISAEGVNFHEFATFFKEQLHCSNALYLDGFVCQYFIPAQGNPPRQSIPLGPIITVSAP